MFRFALANLLSRPGRTLLSVFGLTIAIAGMVGLFSIAGGINSLIDTSFGDIDGVVVLQNGAPIPLFSTLPSAWGEEMSTIDGVHVVNPELWYRANLIDGKPILSPPRLLFGTDLPTRINRRNGVIADDIQEGRFLSTADIGTNHAVISRQIAEEFAKSVGDTMTVNGTELEIVGIYESGSILIDVTIVVDIDLLRRMIRSTPDAVSAFYVEPVLGVSNETIIARIKERFRHRKLPPWQAGAASFLTPGGLPEGLGQLVGPLLPSPLGSAASTAGQTAVADASDAAETTTEAASPGDGTPSDETHPLSVQSVVDYGNQFQDLMEDLDIILALLTGLGVAIAVSSILNTMLMSVTERIVEFGILRANGWSQRDVVQLITCEAALLGLAGGVLGVTCGWIATQIINRVWEDRVHLYAGPVLLSVSLIFAILVGMLGGFYPALRAARLSPMEAIRRG